MYARPKFTRKELRAPSTIQISGPPDIHAEILITKLIPAARFMPIGGTSPPRRVRRSLIGVRAEALIQPEHGACSVALSQLIAQADPDHIRTYWAQHVRDTIGVRLFIPHDTYSIVREL